MAKTPKPFSPETLPGEAWGWQNADFANHFVRFVLGDFAETLFTKKFYGRLMQEFGHIAHYNRNGFYETWFLTTRDRVRFLLHTLGLTEDGRPFCWHYDETERAIQQWIRENNLIAVWTTRLKDEQEQRERLLLAALKAKYEPESCPPALDPAPAPVTAPTLISGPTPARCRTASAAAQRGDQLTLDLAA